MLFIGSAFICGCALGFVATWLARELLFPENRDLNSPKDMSILDGNARSRRSTTKKHVPRANTDLIAYQKELQEQGENRV